MQLQSRKNASNRHSPNRRGRRLCFENLESKTMMAADLDWANLLQTTNSSGVERVVLDSGGNTVVLGTLHGTIDLDASSDGDYVLDGYTSAYVAKYDPEGDLVWAHALSGGNLNSNFLDVNSADEIAVGASCDGGAVSIDGVHVDSINYAGPLVFQFDPDGNLDWMQQLGMATTDYSVIDGAYDASGNVVTTGYIKTWNAPSEMSIRKISESGTLWHHRIPAAIGRSIDVDANGNIMIGADYSGTVDFDPSAGKAILKSTTDSIAILKYGSAGNYLWSRSINAVGNFPSNQVQLADLKVDPTGGVYIAGRFTGKVDFDPGKANAYLSSQTWQSYVLKLNSAGNYAWAKALTGTGTSYIRSMDVDAFGNVFAAGYSSGTVDFDPGAGTQTRTSVNNQAFVLKLDSSGSFGWVVNVIATNSWCQSIAVGQNGRIVIGGGLNGSADFDPDAVDQLMLSSDADSDAFLWSLWDL
jgi:hypothetical protein